MKKPGRLRNSGGGREGITPQLAPSHLWWVHFFRMETLCRRVRVGKSAKKTIFYEDSACVVEVGAFLAKGNVCFWS